MLIQDTSLNQLVYEVKTCAPAKEREQLYAQQVKQLYALAPIGIIASLINGSILTFIQWNIVSHGVLLAWLSGLIVLNLLWCTLCYQFRRTPQTFSESHKWSRKFVGGTFASGLIWGSTGVLLFPESSIPHQIFLAFVLGGMIAGATAVYAALQGAFLAYSLPTVTPLVVRFFVLGDDLHVAMGFMSLLFITLMFMTLRRNHTMTIASLKLRFENTSLITHLSDTKERAEQLNNTLKSEILQRQEAEKELTKHREHLESLVVERTEMLRESETQYRLVTEHVTDLIWIMALDGSHFTYISPSIQRLRGYTPEEGMALSLQETLTPPSLELALDVLEEEFVKEKIGDADPGRSRTLELEHRCKNGSTVWAEVNASFLRNQNGHAIGILGVTRDITQRKQAEELLHALVEGTAPVVGGEFFYSLIKHLALSMETRYAFVAECTDASNTKVRTLSFWVGDDFGENFEYELTGTPCEEVVGGTACYHSDRVQVLFPMDKDLVGLEAESYLGMPLCNQLGQVIGHVAVLSDEPMNVNPQRMSILRVFAARAGAELERVQAQKALQRGYDELEMKVQERTGELLKANEALQAEIIERKRAEQALRHSEAQNRALLSAMPDLIIVYHRDGTYLDFKPAKDFETVVSPEDCLGRKVSDVLPKELAQQVMWQIHRALQTNDVQVFEYEISKIGKRLTYEARFVVSEKDTVLSIVRDITKRKQAGEGLRRYREVISNSSEAIALVDLEGYYLEQNSAHAKLLGYSNEELCGRTPALHLGEDVFSTVAQELVTKGTYHGELNSFTKSGALLPIELSAFAVKNETGDPLCYVGIKRDIAQRKKTEEAWRLIQRVFDS